MHRKPNWTLLVRWLWLSCYWESCPWFELVLGWALNPAREWWVPWERAIGKMDVVYRELNFHFGKFLANPAAKVLLVFRLQTAAGDEPLHRVQQFQPVLQRRFRHGLPLIKALFALEKQPFPAHALGINLQLHALVGHPLPTDFSLGMVKSEWHFRVHSRERSSPATIHADSRLRSSWQIHARHGHRGDAFLAPDETHVFVRRGLDADLFFGNDPAPRQCASSFRAMCG